MGQRLLGKALSMPPPVSISGSDLDRQVVDLEAKLTRLMTVTEAMWEMLASHGHTQDELMQRVEAVEMRALERTTRAVDCPGCGSRLSPDHPRCQICGADTVIEPPRLGY